MLDDEWGDDSDELFRYDTMSMFHAGFYEHIGMSEAEWIEKFQGVDSTPIYWNVRWAQVTS